MVYIYYCSGDAYRHRRGHSRVRVVEIGQLVWGHPGVLPGAGFGYR
ncbi:hypothetical protein [Candidatus Methylacidiphilum infernorum]|nr:hypothetical protein [Candidatus Methylacidiphilum infernorum]